MRGVSSVTAQSCLHLGQAGLLCGVAMCVRQQGRRIPSTQLVKCGQCCSLFRQHHIPDMHHIC
jgi:hypothetical protein